jgi:RNA polymerase sigma factor (TIGR02999 family)
MKPEPEEKQKQQKETVAVLLAAWSQGDQSALEQLIPLVDAELRRLASYYLSRQKRGHTLQTTALINEVYLRLLDGAQAVQWQDRAHFIAIAANLMRQTLVDHYRRWHESKKRGGDFVRVSFDQTLGLAAEQGEDLLALDEALTLLAAKDKRAARIVELRFFAGLSVAETAAVVGVSTDTVARDWKFAQSWLLSKLSGKDRNGN